MREDYAAMYGALHQKEKKFSGKSITPSVPAIARLVEQTNARRLLDYGCGKGKQYDEMRVHDAWGGNLPYRYDPGVKRFSERPKGAFDGVICTDVMEHIAEDDVDEVLADIFSFLPERRDGGVSFAYFYVACRPAKRKTLPDGRNVHLTVRPPVWWAMRFSAFARDKLIIEANYDEAEV
jgi:hypothetical protein